MYRFIYFFSALALLVVAIMAIPIFLVAFAGVGLAMLAVLLL